MSDPIPIDVALRFRKMSPDLVELALTEYELTDEQRERYLSIAGTALVAKAPVEPAPAEPTQSTIIHHRRKLFAALWLLGASYRQIARSEVPSVSPQSVGNLVNRVIDEEDKSQRIRSSITHEEIMFFRQLYSGNKDILFPLTPYATAQWLHQHAEQAHE